MSQALSFQSVVFDVIQQNQQPWVRGIQIGYALGYPNPRQSIAKLYDSHADEFTAAMTTVVTLPTEGGPQETRIFSLRGCHLLAMFARTPVAKQFRRWVLDVLDRLAEEERARAERVENPDRLPGALPDRPSRRTDPERKQLTAIINTWVGMAPIHYANARAQVNAHFGVASVDALTVAQVKEAITWVQAKIDALPPAPEQLALPSAKKDKFEAYIDQVEAFRVKTYEGLSQLQDAGLKLMDWHRNYDVCGSVVAVLRNWLWTVAISPCSLNDRSAVADHGPLNIMRKLNRLSM